MQSAKNYRATFQKTSFGKPEENETDILLS